MWATEPRLVVEVLSRSTRLFDQSEKLEEYKTVPGLAYILLLDPDAPQARLLSRDPAGAWRSERVAGLDAAVRLPALGLALPLAELYRGLAFRPGPAAVMEEQAPPPVPA